MIPIKALSILLLAAAVTKFGHPLRAAVLLGAITAGLGLVAGNPVQTAAAQGSISLAVAAVVFWLIDRTESIVLGTLVTIGGVAALILFA
jgi:hypothetical protein